jgi:hypothetical protein
MLLLRSVHDTPCLVFLCCSRAQPAYLFPAVAPVAVLPIGATSVPIILGPGVMPWAGPDGATSSALFVVADSFNVSKVTLSLTNLRHAFAGDVSLSLASPSGASVQLVTSACDGAWFGGPPLPNYTMPGATYTFDDAAPGGATLAAFCAATMTPKSSGPSIASDAYLPQSPLRALAGALSAGEWVLTYGDAAVGGACVHARACACASCSWVLTRTLSLFFCAQMLVTLTAPC